MADAVNAAIVTPLELATAFEVALSEDRRGRPQALKAYFGLIEGLRFGSCAMCSEPRFLEPSRWRGWTCAECELGYVEVMDLYPPQERD